MRALLRRLTLLALCASLAGLTSCSGDTSSREGRTSAEAHPPVVMLVLDEFPTTSLLGKGGRIDPVRYPSFAALAGNATWFPFATASLDETGRAMRSLLTGRTTSRYAKPTYATTPRNLFALMGRRYRLNASEEVTSLCPRRLCPAVRRKTQRSILRSLARGRPERLERWLGSVRPGSRATFYFKHILFPHAPWRYLPSGAHYVEGPTQKRFSFDFLHSNRWLVSQRYQQHLLQVGFSDRLLGKALARLRATGLYDRSLVIVTADNGEGFGQPGNGHEISGRNAGDIALTPLFVKLPNQREGRVVDRHARTIDVVPTIARIAHLRANWRIEGRSLFGPAARRIPASTLLVKRSGQRIHLSRNALRARAAAALRLKLKLFGAGQEAPGLYGVGPFGFMRGTPVARWQKLPPGGTRAVLDLADRYSHVRRASGFLPVKVMGRLTGRGSRAPADLAVAVNDTIAATAPTLAPRRGSARYFSALIPEGALHDGANRIGIFAIVRGASQPRLRALSR